MALSFNDRQVLELIFLGDTSRIQMAEALGLTGASLTRIVSRLMEEGLIEERAEKTGQQGQPRRLLSVVSGRHFGAGVNFSRRHLQVALVDLAGRVAGIERIPIEDATPKTIVAATEQGLGTLLAAQNLSRSDLAGFGVSVPGNFGRNAHDFRAHELFPQIEGLSFADDLTAMFDAPVFFENDGSCATLGEYMFGAGRGIGHLFLVHIGHGFGGGGIINGRLFRGAHGNACLPGPIFPIGAPRPSGQDLLDELKAKGLGEFELTDPALMDERLQPAIAAWIARAGEQLSRAVLIISGLFDPSAILVGGRLPAALNQALVDEARAHIGTLPGPSRGLETALLSASGLGPDAGAVGAACLPLFAKYFAGAAADTFSNYRNGRRRLDQPIVAGLPMDA